MEDLIKQAFLHVDVIGPHVHEGHYDLVGPEGEIILPQIWETMIKPDWSITMHMWPMPEPPEKPADAPPPPLPPPPIDMRAMLDHVKRHKSSSKDKHKAKKRLSHHHHHDTVVVPPLPPMNAAPPPPPPPPVPGAPPPPHDDIVIDVGGAPGPMPVLVGMPPEPRPRKPAKPSVFMKWAAGVGPSTRGGSAGKRVKKA